VSGESKRPEGKASCAHFSTLAAHPSPIFARPPALAQIPEGRFAVPLVRALLKLTNLPRDGASISANRLTPLSCSLYSTEPRFCRGKKMNLGSRNRTHASLAFFLFVIFSFAAVEREARAERPLRPENAPADLSAVVESGVDQERAHHWIDAIETYEKALKSWPENSDLKYGLRRSKIHFGIERRYNDASFENRLLRLPRYAALELFNDVLEHVRLYYVDEMGATSFVAHGTESLYIALGDEKFLDRNLRGIERERVADMRRILRERFWNRPVPDYSIARETVSEVCDLATAKLGLSDTAVVLEYVFGGCNCLDEYSNFLTPDRLTDLHGNINGEFVGLGIEMKGEPGKGMYLVNVLPESPAEQGGLRPGDYITEIDGTNCRDMTTDEAAKLLRGPQGSRVSLVVQNPGEERPRPGDFVRRAVEVKSIPVAQIVDPHAGIAYIRMTGFQSTSPRELDAALAKLSHEGMRALIWDLRGNPGGLLPAATGVLDRFIDSGVLVSTRGRSSDQNSSYSATPHAKYEIPLVLLVDEDSASASEIVAGAIRDHHRGTIVGRQTYGKWCVQSIYHMPDGAGLRLTTAKFYSPLGHNLTKVGVKPDIAVPVADASLDMPEHHTAFKNPSALKNGQNGDGPHAQAPDRHVVVKSRLGGRRLPSADDGDMKAALDVLERQMQQITGR
jgi:carboxyl-terminal processing protease